MPVKCGDYDSIFDEVIGGLFGVYVICEVENHLVFVFMVWHMFGLHGR